MRKTDAEILLALLGECCCECECEHPQQTPADAARPRTPQMLGKRMPPLDVPVQDDPALIPPYPSFDSPQRAAALGVPHVPLLLDAMPGTDPHEGRFDEVNLPTLGLPLEGMALTTGEVRSVPSGALVIDQTARTIHPGPVRVISDPEEPLLLGLPEPLYVAGQMLSVPVRNNQAMIGVTDRQPVEGFPELGSSEVPLNDTSAGLPNGIEVRYDLLDTRDLIAARDYPPGLTFGGAAAAPLGSREIIGPDSRLAARVGVTYTLRTYPNGPTRPYVDTTVSHTEGWHTEQTGYLDGDGVWQPVAVASLVAGGQTLRGYRYDNVAGAWVAAGPLAAASVQASGGGYSLVVPPGRDESDPTRIRVSATFRELWVLVRNPGLTGMDTETFRRHFAAPGVEVWGSAVTCSGLRRGDVHDLTGGAELRVNGRVYVGGSWTALRAGTRVWVLHLSGSTLTREVVGVPDPPGTCTVTDLMTLVCRRPDLTPVRLAVGALHHAWPHDRAALLTSGPTLHLAVWDAWRDGMRAEWQADRKARPKRRDLLKPDTPLPPAPPLGLTLADAGVTVQWDAVPAGSTPHLLPTRVEVWSEARQAWEESPAALAALAKPLAFLNIAGVIDDRTGVSGRLRVTYPAAPWAAPQPRTVLTARTRTPVRALTIAGQTVTPYVLGREPVYLRDGLLRPPRGWHPITLTLSRSHDPTAPATLELDTHGARLSRLLLTLTGPEGRTET
ncbi:hypothetical protein [Deinococcus aquiradiocola]|uniref:Uncharacterized protein n=1 Tax=Deinococcus aquiradiocola TaxID=393059 RepID=A0A917P7K7_9DEIO|nr:hypothetical protein [Deinococcus aquiradiocola]GGJ65403.1 hypothetical protein GCM10008939_06680 [Deinococcus aquiradiocola]